MRPVVAVAATAAAIQVVHVTVGAAHHAASRVANKGQGEWISH